MSKLLYVIYRNFSDAEKCVDSLQKIGTRLAPDNVVPKPTRILDGTDSFCAIFNPMSTLDIRELSVCMGYTSDLTWDILGKRPSKISGSYAIFRNTERALELVTDMVASRTIWYYYDDELFLASTSQRAIIMYLGSFMFNGDVIPWMLSSGTLGPDSSYDKRIHILEANTILNLDKKCWVVDKKVHHVNFANKYKSRNLAKNALKEALQNVLKNIALDNNKIMLPLSGGYDSRAILLFWGDKKSLKTITWGTRESCLDKDSDTVVAKELAEKYNVTNMFFTSFSGLKNIDEIFHRFIACGEGRIDQMAGYLDGMEMWKFFFENNYECLLRGDEIFGDTKRSYASIKNSKGLLTLNDYINCRYLLEKCNLKPQIIPQYLNRKRGEPLYKWVGRLVFKHEQRIIYSALSDVKLSYVELINPLLFSDICEVVLNSYTKKNTEEKKLFKEIVEEECQNIKIAINGSNKSFIDFLKTKEVMQEFHNSFNKFSAYDVIPEKLIEFVNNKLVSNVSVKESKTMLIKRICPRFVISIIKNLIAKREINYNLLFFRLYILIKTYEMMSEDSCFIGQIRGKNNM